jgi:tryptophan-rich sensory protein
MPQTPTAPHRLGRFTAALAATVPVVAVAVLGNAVTLPNIAPWYADLVKPPFNPPNAVFGPVWTTLYALMVFACFRVLRRPEAAEHRSAVLLFSAQLTLNAAWSVAFFGFRSPAAGLVVIVALIAALIATLRAFLAIDRPAAWALVPYLAWVGFALVLNLSIWWLN